MDLIWVLVVILLVAWLLGAFVLNVGSLIHILLVVVVIVIIVRLIQGRRIL